ELLRQVDRIQIDKEAWELGINLFRAKHKSESEKSISQLSFYQKQYNQLQDKLNRLIDMRASGELTKEEFLTQKAELLKEQNGIRARLSDRETSAHNWLELAETFLNTAFHSREIMESGDVRAKRGLITAVG